MGLLFFFNYLFFFFFLLLHPKHQLVPGSKTAKQCLGYPCAKIRIFQSSPCIYFVADNLFWGFVISTSFVVQFLPVTQLIAGTEVYFSKSEGKNLGKIFLINVLLGHLNSSIEDYHISTVCFKPRKFFCISNLQKQFCDNAVTAVF